MHIALCDDNVADRKQFERLAKRESDRRAATDGILYVDSFGNADSLLANPMQYDVFYIDMCKTPGITGGDVVRALTEKGVIAPIVMCCSDVNYRLQEFPENVLFLDKPIKADELSDSITHALCIAKQAVPQIELRIENHTLYLTEPDILYAQEDGRKLNVHLRDGKIVTVLDNARNMFSQLENFPAFILATPKILLNCRYISQVKFGKATMTDGKRFPISRSCASYARSFSENLPQ